MFARSSTFMNCTFVNNMASVGGGFWCVEGSTVRIGNSIIAFNNPGDVYCDGGATATLTCCDNYGNTGGDWTGCIANQYGQAGNFAADPKFCDVPRGNYSLSHGSPCAPENNPGCGLIGALGVGCDTPAGIGYEPILSEETYLSPGAPSPFRRDTRINYVVPSKGGETWVQVAIYDPAGRVVRTLVSDERSPGQYSTIWDGKADNGSALPTGVYFCRLRAGRDSRAQRLLLLR